MKIYYIGVRIRFPSPVRGAMRTRGHIQAEQEEADSNSQVIRNTKPAHELCAVKDLSSFSYFQRSTVGEFLTMFSGTVAERTGPASRQDIEEQCTPPPPPNPPNSVYPPHHKLHVH